MKLKWAFCIVPFVASGPAGAQGVELTKEELAATLPGVQPDEIHDSLLPGMYEIILDSDVVYVSRDGMYLIQATL